MDIKKKVNRKSTYRKYWYIPVVLVLVIGLAIYMSRYQNVTYVVDRTSVLVDQVREGELMVTVNGYGKLTPESFFIVGAKSDGLVNSIAVRAGDVVQEGDVLVELFNPQLSQEKTEWELELAALIADNTANRITRESQLLDLQSEVANAEIEYQDVKLDLDAQDHLIASGQPIVSRLEHERTQLTVQKYQQYWEIQLQRVEKFKEALTATSKADEARVMKAEGDLNRLTSEVESLTVRATTDGIVQGMSLRQGEQVRQGQEITRIASPDDLVAEIKVQELLVNSIQLGMSATINTRNNVIEGEVSRINPAVVDGTVLIEVKLFGRMPSEARPDLNVDATIQIDRIENTVFVRRPVFAQPFSDGFVYRLNAEGNIAIRSPVRYGQASTNFIEVLEGLAPVDRIVTSDPSDWLAHERIFIR